MRTPSAYALRVEECRACVCDSTDGILWVALRMRLCERL